jgi:hypothetical protein
VIAEKGDRAKVAADAGAMRARLAEAGRAAGTWTVKDGPGGMQDIELAGPGRRADRWRDGTLAGRATGGGGGHAAGSRRTMPSG